MTKLKAKIALAIIAAASLASGAAVASTIATESNNGHNTYCLNTYLATQVPIKCPRNANQRQ